MTKDLKLVWQDWQDRELEAEQQLLQVNQGIDEVSKHRAVRLVPMQQLSMLQVELNKARAASEQHQSEFEARSREQAAKIAEAQATIETLTRELSAGRQRNFDEEARLRETHVRRLEVLHLKIQELSGYKQE